MLGLNLKLELWRPCKQYPVYEVSNLGRIRNSETKYIRSINIIRGYGYVTLKIKGKPKTCQVHRLVAEAFVPNPENKPQVNHKDCNKLNNQSYNLEWATRSENIKHAYDNNLVSKMEKNTKLTEEEVIEICKLLEKGVSRKEIVKTLNLTEKYDEKNLKSIISRIRVRECWTRISKDFNFEKKAFADKDLVEKICAGLQKYGLDIKYDDLLQKLGLENTTKHKKLIYSLKNKRAFIEISDRYF